MEQPALYVWRSISTLLRHLFEMQKNKSQHHAGFEPTMLGSGGSLSTAVLQPLSKKSLVTG